MYSFLINTLFSNEMTASDLLFGSLTKNIKDVAIQGLPTICFPLCYYFSMELCSTVLLARQLCNMSYWLDSWRLHQVPQIPAVRCFFILLGTQRISAVYPRSHSMIGRRKIQTWFLQSWLGYWYLWYLGSFWLFEKLKLVEVFSLELMWKEIREWGWGKPFSLM